MVGKLIALLAGFVISTISAMGYGGIVLLMAIESACIPLPSEIIMPFAGYLVSRGEMNLWYVALAGAVGNVLGSIVAYYAGLWGGRRLIERYGRYVLVSHHDLDIADRWFERHGEISILIARMLPVVRTFIAFPAGIARMNLARFSAFTFVGSFGWSLMLAWIGLRMGEEWDTLGKYFHKFDFVIGVLLVVAAVWHVRRHLRNIRR